MKNLYDNNLLMFSVYCFFWCLFVFITIICPVEWLNNISFMIFSFITSFLLFSGAIGRLKAMQKMEHPNFEINEKEEDDD